MAVMQENVRDFLGQITSRDGHDDVVVARQVPAGQALYAPPRRTVPLPTDVSLRRLTVPSELVLRRSHEFVRLATPSQQYAQVFALPLPEDKSQRRWLKLHLRVLEGGVGICVLDLGGSGCLARPRSSEPGPGRHRVPSRSSVDGAARLLCRQRPRGTVRVRTPVARARQAGVSAGFRQL